MDPLSTAPHQPQRTSTSTPIAVSDLRTAALGVARDGRIMNEEGAQITEAFREARGRLGGAGFDDAFTTMLGQLTAERDGLAEGSDVHKQRDLALKMLYHVWNLRDVAQP